MPPRQRKKTCYRYPWSSTQKAKAPKKRPARRYCRRKLEGGSKYSAQYNRWDVKTGRPRLRRKGTSLRSLKATRPGARAGQYQRSGSVRMSAASLDREIKRLMAQRTRLRTRRVRARRA